MSFYHAYYKRQILEVNGEWKDTMYNHQSIIVIANNLDEAKKKIEQCLQKVETGKFRAILSSNVEECIGISFEHGFDYSMEVLPVYND